MVHGNNKWFKGSKCWHPIPQTEGIDQDFYSGSVSNLKSPFVTVMVMFPPETGDDSYISAGFLHCYGFSLENCHDTHPLWLCTF